MQKARLYDAITLVNRGIDETVQGLERLKHVLLKNSGFDPACFDEKIALLELHRALLNGYFCSSIGRTEEYDLARFEKKHREYEKTALDEVQVYRDLIAVEQRRRVEGNPPKIRFLTNEEQAEWERQYPRPYENAGAESPQKERCGL